MKLVKCLFVLMLFVATTGRAQQQQSPAVTAYIDQYKALAMEEMQRNNGGGNRRIIRS